jgi:hypothetical protein
VVFDREEKDGGRSEERGVRGEIRSITRSSILDSRSYVGPGFAGGDAGGDVEGHEALARAGVAHEERHIAERDAAGPEPLDARRLDVGKAESARAPRGHRQAIGGRQHCIAGSGWDLIHGRARIVNICTVTDSAVNFKKRNWPPRAKGVSCVVRRKASSQEHCWASKQWHRAGRNLETAQDSRLCGNDEYLIALAVRRNTRWH